MVGGTEKPAKSLRGTGGHNRSPLREPWRDGTRDVADAFPNGEVSPFFNNQRSLKRTPVVNDEIATLRESISGRVDVSLHEAIFKAATEAAIQAAI